MITVDGAHDDGRPMLDDDAVQRHRLHRASHKVVLGAIVLDMLAVLLGSVMALLPIFARDIFVIGPLGFGILRAAPAVGAIVTGLVLARWPVSDRVGRVMFITVTIFGIGRSFSGWRRVSFSPSRRWRSSAPPTRSAW